MSKTKKNNQLKLTMRGRHAVMAMVELIKREEKSPVPLSHIAKSGNISLSYLEQLFAGLRRHGLVKSFRGPGGGYVLAKPATEIFISDVLISAEDCVPAKRQSTSSKANDFGNSQTKALWGHIEEILHICLEKVSLDDVANDNLEDHPLTNKLFEIMG